MNRAEKKEQLLIKRVFKTIAEHHFNDHKMVANYVGNVYFDRQVGDDVAEYVEKHYPEYYKKSEDLYKDKCVCHSLFWMQI